MKQETPDTLARQWTMLRAIPRAPNRITTSELAARLDDEGHSVARRTIERDLQALSTRFALVLDDRSKPFGWSWARGANFAFTPALSPAQAVALLLARSHLQGLLPTSLHKELEPIFNTAQASLGSSSWQDWHRRTAVVPPTFQPRPPRIAPDVLATVEQALARRRVLELNYQDKATGIQHPRTAHPLGLLVRGPVTYLVATLFDYKDIRHLALHRISQAMQTNLPAREPTGFNLAAHVAREGAALQSKGTIRFEADFDPPAALHLRESPLSDDQTWTEMDEETVRITATVDDDMRFRWWLLAFGSQIVVCKPAPLRRWIAAELAEASQSYCR
jgi:predicted DNA-binding transcriptional regulator YafY